MGTFASFLKSHVEERKSRKRLITISVLVLLLTALIAGVVGVRILMHRSGDATSSKATTPEEAVKSICSFTLYPKSCYSSLIPANSADAEVIFKYSLAVAKKSLEEISHFPDDYASRVGGGGQMVKQALAVCGAVLRDAADSLSDAVLAESLRDTDDLRTWLSAALTNQDTCLDALAEAGADFAGEVERLMLNATEFASNSLAIVSKLLAAVGWDVGDLGVDPGHRRRMLLEAEEGDGVPAWVDRRILVDSSPMWSLKPNVVVAKDGTGDVTTIKKALEMAPEKSNTRFVIQVKAGEYEERVVVEKNIWNVVLVGDGKTITNITGSLNNVGGVVTFNTSTLAIFGKGFVAKGLTIKNTAGPENHQAVAMMSKSDFSVFYECSFTGYQDTLYAHSNRQFYRNCEISGTIDFIFGNAAVVFQNCTIIPIQPMANQFITITAQGKKDPNQNSGTSIHMCAIRPFNITKGMFDVYLGRPWKDYATTVIMQTYISEVVSPLGWTPWVQTQEPSTKIFYGEYKNTGGGANTSQRVKWKGYKPDLGEDNAIRFTVDRFIFGSSWLREIGVPFMGSLIK